MSEKMKREEAIRYLKRKGKIYGETSYDKDEEKEIEKVMKEGKIYGDPCVEMC